MNASAVLTNGFALLAALTAAGALVLVQLAYRNAMKTAAAALLVGGWLALPYTAASRDLIRFDTRPPSFFVAIAVALLLALTVALSSVGARLAESLSFAALIALQGFRLPLELLMHRAYAEGVMPVQMSYSGHNFDIVTGASAIILAMLLSSGESPWRRAVVRVWNVVGALLLVNIVTIAALSTPTPLRQFHNEPANVWVRVAPFIWLPTFFVPLALIGHIVIARKLRRARIAQPGTPGAAA